MIFQLENVEKAFPGKNLFSNLNLKLESNMRLAIVGPNGCGKTTLLNIISKDESPDKGKVIISKDVRVGYLKQNLSFKSNNTLYNEVLSSQKYLKEIESKLKKLETSISKAECSSKDYEEYSKLQNIFENSGGYTLEANVSSVLFGLGFKKSDLDRCVNEFSGGWKMRIALAKLLVEMPDLLLLDEPTNHLDLMSVSWLEAFLSNIKSSIVIVSHDREFLDNVINCVADITNSKLVLYKGNYSEYETQKNLHLEQIKIKRTRQLEEIKRLNAFVERFRYKASKAKQAQNKLKKIEIIKNSLVDIPHSSREVHFNFEQPRRVGDIVINLKNISKSYGSNFIYRDLNLKVYRGDKIALVGPNGSGKSTLLKLMSKAIMPNGGKVQYGSHVECMYYAQHQSDTLNNDNTVYAELEGVATNWNTTQIMSLLGAFLFKGPDTEKRVEVLSGGEKSRLALAKMLCKPSPLLCLDEPTNHLDIASVKVLEDALKKYKGTIVIISHDRHLLNYISNKVIEINNGLLTTYEGNYDYYLYKKELSSQSIDSDKENSNDTNIPKLTKDMSGVSQVSHIKEPIKKIKNSHKKSKEQKRAEAEARNTLYSATHKWKDELAQINEDMQVLNDELKELNIILSDPNFYITKPNAPEIIEHHGQVKKELEDLEDKWLEVTDKIEDAHKKSGL